MSKLVKLFSSGKIDDRQRFESLVRPHLPLLYRKARHWTQSHEDAEDLVQDVLVKLAGRVETLAGLDNPAPWLVKVLYRRFVDHYRSRARNPVSAESELAPEHEADGERAGFVSRMADEVDNFETLDLREELMMAINSLDEDQRRVFILHEVKGYTEQETARLLRVKPGTIKSRNSRAKQHVKRFLEAGTFPPSRTC